MRTRLADRLLDELPAADRDRLRSVGLLIAQGRELAECAAELGLYARSRHPGRALGEWCRRRGAAYAEALAWGEREAGPRLERLARRAVAEGLAAGDLALRLRAAGIVLQDRRRAEEIAVRRERREAPAEAEVEALSEEMARELRDAALSGYAVHQTDAGVDGDEPERLPRGGKPVGGAGPSTAAGGGARVGRGDA